MRNDEDIALFDMDGVVCDWDFAIKRDLLKIHSPYEPPLELIRDKNPRYIEERIKLITNQQGWWANLPKYKPGFDILEIAKELDFQIYILTKASRKSLNSYTEKVLWLKRNMPDFENIKIIQVEDKSNIYGKVLVEDYPKNILGWLKYRKRGLVIMPIHSWNEDFQHKQVIPYDGKNLEKIRGVIKSAKERKPRENI